MTVADNQTCQPPAFLARIRLLEDAYLTSDGQIEQSGFHGGAERWRMERSPILRAVQGDGRFLDIGCANGYLLECLVRWARECGLVLERFGGGDRAPADRRGEAAVAGVRGETLTLGVDAMRCRPAHPFGCAQDRPSRASGAGGGVVSPARANARHALAPN